MGHSARNLVKFFYLMVGIAIALFVLAGSENSRISVSAAPAPDYIYYLPIINKAGWTGTWKQVAFSGEDVTDLQNALNETQHLYASVYLQGLYETVNGGNSWQKHNNVNTRINEITISPMTNQTIYLATMSSDGVYQTLDGGQQWMPLSGSPSMPFNLYDIAVNPTEPEIILVGGRQWEQGWGALFKTNNSGETWHSITGFTPLDIVFNPISSNIVYVGSSSGVIKSVDTGESWILINDGLPSEEPYNVYEVVFHPNDPDYIYIATATGVYGSRDAGDNWEPLLTDIDTRSIIFDPDDEETLFAGTNNGIYVSHNDGANWYSLDGCIDSLRFNSLVFDLVEPDLLWAGTSNGLWSCHIRDFAQ